MERSAKDKFTLRQLTTTDAFNYEIELPIYDGLVICYVDEKGKQIDLLTITLGLGNVTFKAPMDIKLSDYITTYNDFKFFDLLVEKCKYHLKLAHEISAGIDSLLDD